jgi:hypothetical protein
MTAKELGIRKLGGLDIVRVGDFQWTKDSRYGMPTNIDSFDTISESDTDIVGKQMQTEYMQDYPNFIYRKLNKNVTPQQTNPTL